ncbi:MAG: potassium channel family protein [Pseudomonadota bacterium]
MATLYAAVLAMVMAGISILIHFEALSLLNAIVRQIKSQRGSVLCIMSGLLLAHVVEIWLYGGAYALLERTTMLGGLINDNAAVTWIDTVYFSAMVYTTVGFGDIIPIGPIRLIAGTEALVGLSLITWSASFAFIQMQKLWR